MRSELPSKDFGRELEARTRRFAVMIIKLSGRLPKTTETMVIRNQLTKAGTSVGANYREANRARSRADFKSKIRICESELSETQYWLEVIAEAGWTHQLDIAAESDKCRQLLALFSSIAKNCA